MSKLDTILENVTVDNLLEFKEDMFAAMTTLNTKGNLFAIGLNGNGDFVVKDKTSATTFGNAHNAVDYYRQIVTEHYESTN
jgi:hypothetical protein